MFRKQRIGEGGRLLPTPYPHPTSNVLESLLCVCVYSCVCVGGGGSGLCVYVEGSTGCMYVGVAVKG